MIQFKLLPLLFCVSSVFGLELKNLCEDRVYLNNALINSFYQLRLEKDLEPVSNYVNDDDEPSKQVQEEIINQLYSNRMNLTEIVENFKRLDPKSSPSPLARNKRWPKQINYELRSTYDRISSTVEPPTTTQKSDHPENESPVSGQPSITTMLSAEDYIESVNKLAKPINKLRRNLELLALNRISEEWVAKEDLKLELDSVNQDLNETQTSVFQNQILDAFYNRPIAMLDDFSVERNQSIYLDDTAVMTLKFSLYIPFYDQNKTVDEFCFSLTALPDFYKSQTLNAGFAGISNAKFNEELAKSNL